MWQAAFDWATTVEAFMVTVLTSTVTVTEDRLRSR
jgi:hypothetical protein